MKKFLASAICLIALQAQAGVILDNTITGSITNNFDALSAGNAAGLIVQTGATYGERFSGQTINTGSGFDAITGTPTSLTLLANASIADNIGILPFGIGNVIYGNLASAIGEGALSILLGSGSDVFGFNVVGSDGGQFLAQFFAADGSVIGSSTQGGDGFYGFRTTGGDQIFGVSLTNTDVAGIGFDNVTFNARVAEVPEPASMALFGLGMLGFAAARRRKH